MKEENFENLMKQLRSAGFDVKFDEKLRDAILSSKRKFQLTRNCGHKEQQKSRRLQNSIKIKR